MNSLEILSQYEGSERQVKMISSPIRKIPLKGGKRR